MKLLLNNVFIYRLVPFFLCIKEDRDDGVEEHRRRDVLIIQFGKVVVPEILEHVEHLAWGVTVEYITPCGTFYSLCCEFETPE